jgi:hypothetical protein
LVEAVTSLPRNIKEQRTKNKEQKNLKAGEVQMQVVADFLQWLQATSLAVFIHEHRWALTTIEVVHVFAIGMMVATISIVDSRLMGLAFVQRPFTELARRLLPVTWTAFVVAVLTGPLLFINQATDHFANTMFRIKMLLIVLAGINMLIFELITVRGAPEWDLKPIPPLSARLAGAFSIGCWFLVIVFGRLTGFTMPQQ